MSLEKGIQLISGPMFCGKTDELMRRLRGAEIAKRRIQLFKPSIDIRDSEDNISTHYGLKMPAIVVENTRELVRKLDKSTEIVAIDEASFFDWELIDFCRENQYDRLIILTALNLTYRGEPFPFRSRGKIEEDSDRYIHELMAYADERRLKAICTFPTERKEGEIYFPIREDEKVCGEPAIFSQRFGVNGALSEYNEKTVIIGGKEQYMAVCRNHFIKPQPSI